MTIVYADFECPYCAALELRLRELPLTVVFRHFPVRSSHPRAWPAACAAEAAGRQGRFWEMHDLLFGDQARLEDPHLWDRARRLGLDLDRFDDDRRRDDVRERVKARLPLRRTGGGGDDADALCLARCSGRAGRRGGARAPLRRRQPVAARRGLAGGAETCSRS